MPALIAEGAERKEALAALRAVVLVFYADGTTAGAVHRIHHVVQGALKFHCLQPVVLVIRQQALDHLRNTIVYWAHTCITFQSDHAQARKGSKQACICGGRAVLMVKQENEPTAVEVSQFHRQGHKECLEKTGLHEVQSKGVLWA